VLAYRLSLFNSAVQTSGDKNESTFDGNKAEQHLGDSAQHQNNHE
jgi:hypothetical protein